jgi:hypothetical protein
MKWNLNLLLLHYGRKFQPITTPYLLTNHTSITYSKKQELLMLLYSYSTTSNTTTTVHELLFWTD